MNGQQMKKELRNLRSEFLASNGFLITDFAHDTVKRTLILISDYNNDTIVTRDEMFSYAMKHLWDGTKIVQRISTDNYEDITNKINLQCFQSW